MENTIKFNRHEIFNGTDLSTISSVIRELENLYYTDKTKDTSHLNNYLYGLYDGYLYTEQIDEVFIILSEFNYSLFQDFDILIKKVKRSL